MSSAREPQLPLDTPDPLACDDEGNRTLGGEAYLDEMMGRA